MDKKQLCTLSCGLYVKSQCKNLNCCLHAYCYTDILSQMDCKDLRKYQI